MDESESFSQYMDTKRLETLVDGIFAIAMTLLVLGLAVPVIRPPITNASVETALISIIPNFISLVVSFILLAVFWKIHHRIFKQINKMNGTLLWINVIWLLFIVLVPFSATLTGDYGAFTIANVIFNINMLGIAVLLYLNWHYADHKNFIHEKISNEEITFTKIVNLSFILVAITAIGLSYVIPQYSQTVYIIMLPIEMIIKFLINLVKKGTNNNFNYLFYITTSGE
jgi:uncharacterized membrane protein